MSQIRKNTLHFASRAGTQMSHMSTRDSAIHPPLDGSVIQSVVLVDRVTRTTTGPFKSVSLPGHLIHVVFEGRVEQSSGGTLQEIGPGEAVWYHENEEVSGHIREAPWTFYTVNFVAVRLAAPPLSQRVLPVDNRVLELMEMLLSTWRDTAAPDTRRHVRVHALLLNVIERLLPESTAGHRIDSATDLWWEIESRVRGELAEAIDLRFLEKLTGRSRQTIIRSCHHAVGMSPMKRIKELRLSYAQGLVLHSKLPMTQIALCVGYGRVQEFSRDYHNRFGVTPTGDRKVGPRYRKLQMP